MVEVNIDHPVVCPCAACDGKDSCTLFNRRNCDMLNDWIKGGCSK